MLFAILLLQAKRELDQGKVTEAEEHSSKACKLVILGIVIGFALCITIISLAISLTIELSD